MSKIKQLKDLNLLDRFLFSAVMEDEKSLESILEIILGTDIALKDKAQVEKELCMMRKRRSETQGISHREPGITMEWWI